MSRIAIVVLSCLAVAPVLQGCAGAILAGGVTAANIAHDRRTAGSFVEDQNIELKASSELASDKELEQQTHVKVISYNQVVLLTGQAPSQELRSRAESLVRTVPKVRRVHNEIQIASPSALSARSSDTWITSKVKVRLFRIEMKNFDPTRVKVTTSNGTVYLMGLVTRAEADAVVDVVRKIEGVQRVVKIFEYIG
ncbi:MAG: BON domain-containing protein [Gammaproteobacteria bacterium]|nr:BON domain-containing protein [Gammaproteobacteria bacterium]NIR98306.1 BON domain-containing protein [Gammaproteobacteria bacterium]NIT64053.1 BON domain-containing protein [Gammaproteobacteria bacterium]NIV20984.1 BON domain-containing protein [Gammaproteobacteria bacterium]NIX10381.1 BON domain-containing protein [Gammaproteobacteria bacterium]